MAKLEQAVKDIHEIDRAGGRNTGRGGVHPLSRLLVTFFYILAVLSFHKYNLIGLAGMILYILIQCIWHEHSARDMIRHIWPVLLLTAVVGIANPLFDRNEYITIGNVAITGGMLSMVTLMLKGMFCVMASYLLVIQTGIRQICYSLHLLRIPREIVTMLLLMHRYLVVLMKEAERMQQAYKLRAPGQKGLHFKVWGSFVGLLLLRSIDRAGVVYESMKLRGFDGKIQNSGERGGRGISLIYVIIWGTAIFVLRSFPVFRIVGRVIA